MSGENKYTLDKLYCILLYLIATCVCINSNAAENQVTSHILLNQHISEID